MAANDLAAGVYVIYNSALSFRAETLAITFHDAQTPPTVELLGSVSDNSQQWRVEDAIVPGLQYIVPLKDDTLQACWGADQSVGVAPAAGYVWVINKADNGYYTIEDGSSAAEWGTITGLPSEKITLEGLNGSPPSQWWAFQKQ